MREPRLEMFRVWVEARMAEGGEIPAAVNAALLAQLAVQVATEMLRIERARVTPREDWRELEQAAQLALWSRVLGRREGEQRQILAGLLDRLVGLS
jgi:hypothetical protein